MIPLAKFAEEYFDRELKRQYFYREPMELEKEDMTEKDIEKWEKGPSLDQGIYLKKSLRMPFCHKFYRDGKLYVPWMVYEVDKAMVLRKRISDEYIMDAVDPLLDEDGAPILVESDDTAEAYRYHYPMKCDSALVKQVLTEATLRIEQKVNKSGRINILVVAESFGEELRKQRQYLKYLIDKVEPVCLKNVLPGTFTHKKIRLTPDSLTLNAKVAELRELHRIYLGRINLQTPSESYNAITKKVLEDMIDELNQVAFVNTSGKKHLEWYVVKNKLQQIDINSSDTNLRNLLRGLDLHWVEKRGKKRKRNEGGSPGRPGRPSVRGGDLLILNGGNEANLLSQPLSQLGDTDSSDGDVEEVEYLWKKQPFYEAWASVHNRFFAENVVFDPRASSPNYDPIANASIVNTFTGYLHPLEYYIECYKTRTQAQQEFLDMMLKWIRMSLLGGKHLDVKPDIMLRWERWEPMKEVMADKLKEQEEIRRHLMTVAGVESIKDENYAINLAIAYAEDSEVKKLVDYENKLNQEITNMINENDFWEETNDKEEKVNMELLRLAENEYWATMKQSEKYLEFFLQLLYFMISFPWKKTGILTVMMGGQGLGKTYFWTEYCRTLYGEPGETPLYLMSNDTDQLFGHFQADNLERCLLAHIDEAFLQSQHIPKAKSFVTDLTSVSNRKYGSIDMTRNYANVVMTFNTNTYTENIIKVEADDRRQLIFKLARFFEKSDDLVRFITSLSTYKIWPIFLGYILSKPEHVNNITENWNPQLYRPVTVFYMEQKKASLNYVQKWWFSCLIAKKHIWNNTIENKKINEGLVGDPDVDEPTWFQEADIVRLHQYFLESYKGVNHGFGGLMHFSNQFASCIGLTGEQLNKMLLAAKKGTTNRVTVPSLVKARRIFVQQFKLPAEVLGLEEETAVGQPTENPELEVILSNAETASQHFQQFFSPSPPRITPQTTPSPPVSPPRRKDKEPDEEIWSFVDL